MENLQVLLPGWETVRCIGSGSSGKVYELRKKDEYGGDFHSALKVISIPSTQKEYEEMESTMSEFAMRSKLRDKVEEISGEYRLMGVLRGHPNIVNCEDQMIIPHENDLGWDIYIRMELLTSLPDYVRENGMTVSEVIKLGIDICSALELCRQNNIIHRDIKPQNIFVSKYGGFKLGDFGVAKVSKINDRTDLVGTYSYMAPEVYKGKPYDDRVDIYSLGMVLYWLLNERKGPFLPLNDAPTSAQLADAQLLRYRGEPLPPPKNGNQALKKLVLKATSYDSADRFLSPSEMKQALILAASGQSPVEAPKPNFDSDATVREEFPRREPIEQAQTPPPVQEKPKPQPKKPEPPKKGKEKSDSKTMSQFVIAISVTVVAIIAAVLIFLGISKGWFSSDPSDDPNPAESTKPTPTATIEPTKKPEIISVSISSPRLIMTEGDSATLTASCMPEPEAADDMPEYIWKSSDSSVATVDDRGNVEAISEGTATIMVYVKDKMELHDECMVIVEAPVVTELKIETMPTKTVYTVGEELDTTGLVLRAYYNNGTAERITNPEEYTAACDMNGFGSKTVTVTYGGQTAEYTIRISIFGQLD